MRLSSRPQNRPSTAGLCTLAIGLPKVTLIPFVVSSSFTSLVAGVGSIEIWLGARPRGYEIAKGSTILVRVSRSKTIAFANAVAVRGADR